MAYNDDSVLARLSSLNESHDSIATAAQWIMFHRRHADRTVQLWMQRLKDSSSTKRLSLMYLANEVVQQSRIRHKEDFVLAFSPVVAEASSIAYKGAPAEIQAKLRRVIDVWKDRTIFEPPIQKAIESRLDELDKARGTPRSGFGGSPFSNTSSLPAEFASVVSTHQKITKLAGPLQTITSVATQEYDKQMDPEVAVPSAPVYAARLNGLLKTLANAENAVAECVKARESLVSGLEKLLDNTKTALADERKVAGQLYERKVEIEGKKQQVELAIMQALGPSENSGEAGSGDIGSPHPEPGRPEMEALTPPPLEGDATPKASEALDGLTVIEPATINSIPNEETAITHHQSTILTSSGSNKRRRLDGAEEIVYLADGAGTDAQVADLMKGYSDE